MPSTTTTTSTPTAATAALPGDRYVTQRPCGPQCCQAPASSSPPTQWIAMRPYSFVFRAPVKGRWLGRGLLELFIHEFAYVPCVPDGDAAVGEDAVAPPTRSATLPVLLASSTATREEKDCHGAAKSVFSGGGGATLDRRLTLPAYIEELCDGSLWLQGREAECRAAGRRYRDALVQIAQARNTEGVDSCAAASRTDGLASSNHITSLTSTSDSAAAWEAWCSTVQWLSRLPSQSEVDALMPLLHRDSGPSPASASSPVVPLLLRQRDVVHHRVWRREGRMLAHPPLQLLRCDVASAVARQQASPSSLAPVTSPALIVVNKPPGLPVHPSGCYRKNSVTSILEDVFGGCDGGALYTAEEHLGESEERPYVSVRHRRHGFELMRVFVRPATSSSADAAAGVSMEDWRILRHLLQRRASEEEREEARGSSSGVAPPLKRARETSASAMTQTNNEAREDVELKVARDYVLKAFVVHRLDAATSGVLLFGLNSETARRTAVAIANKTEEEDGEKAVELKDVSDKAEDGLPAASSRKVYYARVHGRVDLAALALTQHHCTLQEHRHQLQQHEEKEGGDVLVVQRPIGCVDHHRSLYWCPDAPLTDSWLREEHEQRVAATASAASAAAGGKGVPSRTPEALAAKHERMRQLTRGAVIHSVNDTTNTSLDVALPSDTTQAVRKESDEAGQRLRQYTQTLRSATTMVSLVHYDAVAQQSVVRCTLGTGRTHQLRVHLASLGHPIVQDEKYMAMEEFLRAVAPVQPLASASGPAHAEPRAADASLIHYYAASSASSLSDSSGSVNTAEGRPIPQFDDARLAHGCVCPDAICLHAWRYVLTYADSGEEVAVEVPLPDWAKVS